ncbi:MAG: hypothetical protein AAGE03_16310 [Pseudomonadota bacterium]
MKRFQNRYPVRLKTEKAAKQITSWLCFNWGFCDAGQQRPSSDFVGKTPDEFAEIVLATEGMETDPYISGWRKQMGDKIEELMKRWEEEQPHA